MTFTRTCKHPNKLIVSTDLEVLALNRLRAIRYTVISTGNPTKAPDVEIGDEACYICLQSPFVFQVKGQQEKSYDPIPWDYSPKEIRKRNQKYKLFLRLRQELDLTNAYSSQLFRV